MSWLRGLRATLMTIVFLVGMSIWHIEVQADSSFEISEPEAEIVTEVTPLLENGHLIINADVSFMLSDELLEAALKGVPLHFTADVEIKSERWWWFDKTEIQKSQTWRVVYNTLTRQWRVGSGDLLWPEASLQDALYSMRHIRNWVVASSDDLASDQTYQGRLRLRLDTSLLTRPLQVDALNGRAWTLATPWKNFSFSVDALQP